MRATARVWAATLVIGLGLSIAHVLGLPDSAFSIGRALCSLIVALCALTWVARDTRMTLVAGLLCAVAWFDAALLPVDLGWRAAESADLLLALGAILVNAVAYMVMATTQVPSDRRGAWAAVAWLAFGGVSLGALIGWPSWLGLVTLAVAVVLTVRFLLGAQLYEISRDDEAAASGLGIYRRALVVHVLAACGVWPLILVLGMPDALVLVLALPYFVMIFGAARYASAAPDRFASIAAAATVLVVLLEIGGTLGAVPAWHARLAAIVAFVALALSLVRLLPKHALGSALGFLSIPVAFRWSDGVLAWAAAMWAVVVVAAFVHLLRRSQAELGT